MAKTPSNQKENSMEEEAEKQQLPNGDCVEFYPSDHHYVYEGVVLPSITTLLKKVYGDTYASVNPEMLQRSATYGTQVHEELSSLIEMRKKGADIKGIVDSGVLHQEAQNYFNFVEPIYKVEPLMTEKIVVLRNKEGKPVAAGRFDLLAKINGKTGICDFKTTSSIHRQLVTAQLNLYLRAAIQTGYLPFDGQYALAAIHLSGEKSKLIPIPVLGESFIEKFTEFEDKI